MGCDEGLRLLAMAATRKNPSSKSGSEHKLFFRIHLILPLIFVYVNILAQDENAHNRSCDHEVEKRAEYDIISIHNKFGEKKNDYHSMLYEKR